VRPAAAITHHHKSTAQEVAMQARLLDPYD